MTVHPLLPRRSLAERVQRIVEGDAPVLHLEPEIPGGTWPVKVDGLVEVPVELCIDELRTRAVVRFVDLHCVWGWSSPGGRWEGVLLDALAGAAPGARFVRIEARHAPGAPVPYASCFTLDEARAGLFAWRLDGRDLPPERGWPLRFVPPSSKWAYKSVKWVERISFLDHFSPGFWEERVGDPEGTIPWDVLQRFQTQADRWRRPAG